MNQDQTDKEFHVERYLRGELGASDADELEQTLLWDRDAQDELVLAQRLREGMQAVAGEPGRPARRGWARLFYSPHYAAAASILLVATSLGWMATWLSFGPDDDTSPSRVASTRVYSLESMRGVSNAENLVSVSPGAASEPVTLLVYPALESHETISVEVARQQDDQWIVIWNGSRAAAGDGDTVAVTLPGSLLSPGIYRVSVLGWTDDSPDGLASADYFRVPGE